MAAVGVIPLHRRSSRVRIPDRFATPTRSACAASRASTWSAAARSRTAPRIASTMSASTSSTTSLSISISSTSRSPSSLSIPLYMGPTLAPISDHTGSRAHGCPQLHNLSTRRPPDRTERAQLGKMDPCQHAPASSDRSPPTTLATDSSTRRRSSTRLDDTPLVRFARRWKSGRGPEKRPLCSRRAVSGSPQPIPMTRCSISSDSTCPRRLWSSGQVSRISIRRVYPTWCTPPQPYTGPTRRSGGRRWLGC